MLAHSLATTLPSKISAYESYIQKGTTIRTKVLGGGGWDSNPRSPTYEDGEMTSSLPRYM